VEEPDRPADPPHPSRQPTKNHQLKPWTAALEIASVDQG